MKLVINTQYKENYAAHNEDFVPGVSADYWKFKGGDTFVVEGMTPNQCISIAEKGIPTLTALLEYSNPASQTYIIDFELLDDDAPVGEEWETPTTLKYADGKWSALKFTTNGDMGYMRNEIHAKSEQWDLLPESDRENYSCQFKVDNGWFESSDPQLKIELARAA
jgi:hypothetical protein|tara:strand:+ start:268 stop:762 length:495 start_codon:yes stop_codon:yes gene_type:complete